MRQSTPPPQGTAIPSKVALNETFTSRGSYAKKVGTMPSYENNEISGNFFGLSQPDIVKVTLPDVEGYVKNTDVLIYNPDAKPENIRAGKVVAGITGNYSGGASYPAINIPWDTQRFSYVGSGGGDPSLQSVYQCAIDATSWGVPIDVLERYVFMVKFWSPITAQGSSAGHAVGGNVLIASYRSFVGDQLIDIDRYRNGGQEIDADVITYETRIVLDSLDSDIYFTLIVTFRSGVPLANQTAGFMTGGFVGVYGGGS